MSDDTETGHLAVASLTSVETERAGRGFRVTAYEIALAIVGPFSIFPSRRYLAVPNVSWGLLNWEADLAVMAPSGWLYEIEIKVTHSDLKADFVKAKHDIKRWGGYGGESWKLIRGFWYAMPERLYALALKAGTEFPAYAGIITVGEGTDTYSKKVCTVVRQCAVNNNARKLTGGERYTLARLGVMRYWSKRESRHETIALKSEEARTAPTAAQASTDLMNHDFKEQK